jgi:hypothetical protein
MRWRLQRCDGAVKSRLVDEQLQDEAPALPSESARPQNPKTPFYKHVKSKINICINITSQ